MSLPTKIKTWTYDPNRVVTAQATDAAMGKQFGLDLINRLLALGVPPTVVGSSNASAAGMDAVNRISTTAHIVGASSGNAATWIVFKFASIATNFQVLWDFHNNSSTSAQSTMWVSVNAGFSGSLTTARPTATDEVQIFNFGSAWFGGVGTSDVRYHLLQSDDGQITRVIACQAGVATMYWAFEKAGSPVTGWTYPGFVIGRYGSTAMATGLFDTAQAQTYHGASSMPLFLSTEGMVGATPPFTRVVASINEIDSTYPMLGCGLISNTVGKRGRHGDIVDMWAGLSSLVTGDTYPSDGSKQFAHFGTIIQPWNGSTPQVL